MTGTLMKTNSKLLKDLMNCIPVDRNDSTSLDTWMPDNPSYQANSAGGVNAIAIIGGTAGCDTQVGHVLYMVQELLTKHHIWRNSCYSYLTNTRRFQFFFTIRDENGRSLSHVESKIFYGLFGWRIFLGLHLASLEYLGFVDISIENIEFQHLLGKGGRGKFVFEWKLNGKDACAVKVFHDQESKDKELSNLRSLVHLIPESLQHMVPTLLREHLMTANGRPSLALTPVCHPVQPCPNGETVYGRDISHLVDLLEAIHSRNMCHRDVKPANVLKRKETGTVLLTDWGSAIKVRHEEVLWQGTIGFYDRPDTYPTHCPHPRDDMIALARSAYLMLYNNPTHLSQDDDAIVTFWKKRFAGHVWGNILEKSEELNYAELKGLYQNLK